MIPGKATVESLKESADLILIRISPRKDYDGFTKVEGRTSCRFIFYQLIILSNVPWKLLCEEITLQTLIHMGIEPHVDKPPRTSQITDGFTHQNLLGHLIGRTQKVSAKGESVTIG
jgi:hypothetical protein